MKNAKSPKGKSKKGVVTLGDWYEAYQSSGDGPASSRANMVGVFRRFAELVGGTSDPQAVELKDAEGLLHRWIQEVQGRQDRGELSKASAAQY